MSTSRPIIYLVAQMKRGVQCDGRIPPFGIMCVGESLRRAGYRVKIFHLWETEGEKILADAVAAERPLFVGFSNCVSTTLIHSIRSSRMVSGQGIKVVWGGVFPTTLPRVTLESGFVDYAVTGDGERPAVALAQAIERTQPASRPQTQP